MEMKFGVLVNEFKAKAIQSIFFGSILMTGETERRITHEEELKIYFFKHNECSVNLKDNHLILFDLPKIKGVNSKGICRRILNTNKIESCEKESSEYKYYLSGSYKNIINNLSYDIGFYDTGFFNINLTDNLFNSYMNYILDIIKIKLNQYDNITIEITNELKLRLETKITKAVNKILNNNSYRNLGKKILINKIDNSIQLILKVGMNLDLLEMIAEANHSKNEIVYTPLFNNMQFEQSFIKVVDSGYMPFLPIYYSNTDILVDEINLEKFNSFVRTLNPRYRKGFENKNQFLKMNNDFKSEILNFFSHFINNKIDILSDMILFNIQGIYYENISVDINQGQYDILIYLLSLQHSIIRLNNYNKTKSIISILDFISNSYLKINDSIITFLLIIITNNISIDYKMLEKYFDKDTSGDYLKSKSTQISILFADLFNRNCRWKFETELNEFFVSNDITIYYNMLAQMLFHSEHGKIHDGKLYILFKKVDETLFLTDEVISTLNIIIPNSIALLKLTKSYDKSIEEVERLEREFIKYAENIRNNRHQIKNLIYEIITEGQKRFKILRK